MKWSLLPAVFLLMVWLLSLGIAQEKTLTLEDVILHRQEKLTPKKPDQLQWLKDAARFSFVDEIDSVHNLFVFEVNNNKPVYQLSLEQLNAQLQEQRSGTAKKFPRIKWYRKDAFYFWKGDSLYTYSINSNKLKLHSYFKEKNAHRDVQLSKLTVAFTRDNSLYILDKAGKVIPVAVSEEEGIVYGESVHRNEFGIRKGTFWSPKGNYLAFYRKDERMVTDYPYVDFNERPAVVKPGKYPMAGMSNHIANIGIFDLKRQQTIWLETGEPEDQYLTNITWGPKERYLYVAQINRDQNHLRMIRYEVKTGRQMNTIFEEQDSAYIDPQVGPFFFHDDPDQFLWLSRRDGWNHLYWYKTNGELIKQVTRGDWEVIKVEQIGKENRSVFITTTKSSPLNRDLYQADLGSTEITRLTRENGTHQVQLSDKENYFLDEFSNLKTPVTISLHRADGNMVREIWRAEDPLKDYRVGELKLLTIPTDNGDSLFARLFYPPDYQPDQLYPLIVYVYGGPHSQMVRNTWLGGGGSWPLWLQYLSSKGYLVFTVDNRGTDFRGKAFEQATFRKLGTVEISDQLLGLREVRQYARVDTTRIGVIGWSYGGFMTTSLMLRAPEVFKVGVAGGPVIDWKYYETIYTERYMDTPESNPEGYQTANTRKYIKNLKGKLLVIHGAADNVVMLQHSILFVKAAVKANVRLDYFIYPGQKHGIRGKDRLHLFNKMSTYLMDNL